MLSRTAINIIRKSICNNARTLYCTRDSLQSNFLMYHNNTKHHNVQNYCNLYVARRFKSSRKKAADSKKNRDEDSDEEEEKKDEEVPTGSKVYTIKTLSIRLDTVSKTGFGISRSKVEEAFYRSKLRVNGRKVFKKSIEVDVGDEIDIVLHKSFDNPELLVVNRIVILSLSPANDSVRIKLSRDKNLLIENYEDPYSE